jgi:hypothetical protein
MFFNRRPDKRRGDHQVPQPPKFNNEKFRLQGKAEIEKAESRKGKQKQKLGKQKAKNGKAESGNLFPRSKSIVPSSFFIFVFGFCFLLSQFLLLPYANARRPVNTRVGLPRKTGHRICVIH